MQPIIAVALMLQQNSSTRPSTRLILTTITCQNLGFICDILTAETETEKFSIETETSAILTETRRWVRLETVSRPRRRDRDHIPAMKA
jgi:hypothetical protein